MRQSDFRHFFELVVRWGDMDVFGHINNVHYFRYLESARIAYLQDALGLSLMAEESVILADIQCSFLHQLHYPAVLEIGTRVSRIGASSIRLASAIYSKDKSTPVATSTGVLVWFDRLQQRSKPVPAAVREKAMSFEVLPPEI